MGSIQVARSSDLSEAESSGKLTRRLKDVDDLVTVAETRTAPEGSLGWHHHGEHTAYVYVRQGQVEITWGPGGREGAELTAGDFYVIPPNTIHREANPGSEEQVVLGFFVGSGPTTFNVDGPEPQ
ncbi:MAG TPA: cupin domain-containing protein [Solirubrobacterales bacterium]